MKAKIVFNNSKLIIYQKKSIDNELAVFLGFYKSQDKTILASIRNLHVSPGNELIENLSLQIENLKSKLLILDSYKLSMIKFLNHFTPGRIFIISPNTLLDWATPINLIQELTSEINIEILFQADYDQKQHYEVPGKLFGNIEFKSAHIPSAKSTVDIFEAALTSIGEGKKSYNIGILGIGNLGSRIVTELQLRKKYHCYIYDINPLRTNNKSKKSLTTICKSKKVLIKSKLDCLIFCSNSGSLDANTIRSIIRNNIKIIGGPEAGLDNQKQYIDLLSTNNIHFIPSLLCGLVGLSSTLEESINGSDYNLEDKLIVMKNHVKLIIKKTKNNGYLFQNAYLEYTNKLQDNF